MDIVFFENKNGESSVITSKGTVMVIDCGDGTGTELIEYLVSKNTHVIDVLVITDFTPEHFGGVPAVMDSFEVDKIYVPGYLTEGEDYEKFMDACDKWAIDPYAVDGSVSFGLGDIMVSVQGAYGSIGVEKGDHSLMTKVSCNKRNFLFTGDAGKARIDEFLQYDKTEYDLIQVPSHGEELDSSKKLVDHAKPKYAVITPMSGSKYDGMKKYLDDIGCEVYSTDKGRVTVSCNGRKIEIK